MGETWQTARLPSTPDATAPDGSSVRLLARVAGASVAHFTLPAGRTSRAVRHRTVDEVWYVLAGRGTMWRGEGDFHEEVPLVPGTAVTIPAGTTFQFRALGVRDLAAVAATVPAWPGEGEAEVVAGPWPVALPEAR